ncbi:MAG: hypothetical protein ACLFWL_03535 [Candidatus Brocadiia bacterium]
MKIRLLAALLLVLCIWGAPHGHPGEKEKPAERRDESALAIKQEGVSSEMRALERKLLRLVQQVRETNPEQAERLSIALKKAREAMLEKRMERISFLLNEVNLDAAVHEQIEVIQDLVNLLETLTKEENYYDELQKKIKQLQQWRKQINKLSREEWEEKRESEKFSNLAKTQKQLADQMARLQELKKQQKELADRTEQARKSGDQNSGKLAQQQGKIRKDTAKLTRDIAEAAGQKTGESGPQSRGQSVPSPSEARTPEPGQQDLTEATRHQKTSQKELSDAKAPSAHKNQEKALAAMERALKQMKREKQRLDALSPDHNKKMARKQHATSRETAQLAKKMESAEKSDSPANSQQNGAQGGRHSGAQSSPQKSLKHAHNSMNRGSTKLQKNDAGKAARDQGKAHEELQKARQEIDKELRELREEQRGALLAKLIAMFQNMLDKQVAITEQTGTLQKKKSSKDWGRTETLRCAELGDGEKKLAKIAQQALKMMQENSSPLVFSQVVKGLMIDLKTLVKRLQAEKTGRLTRSIQKDVEQTLCDLIQALEKAQDNPPQADNKSNQPQNGQSPKPPLVSLLAEVKLLRNLQGRINKRTRSLEKQLQGKGSSADLEHEITTLTDRQKSVCEMAEKFRKKLMGQARKKKKKQSAPEL